MRITILAEPDMYHEAPNRYYAKDWAGKLCVSEIESKSIRKFIFIGFIFEGIVLYREMNLPEDWDSVYVHEHK